MFKQSDVVVAVSIFESVNYCLWSDSEDSCIDVEECEDSASVDILLYKLLGGNEFEVSSEDVSALGS